MAIFDVNSASIGTVSVGSLVGTAQSANSAAINFSAGTTSNNVSQLVFSNANGLSFGLNGSTVTASAAAASINFSAGTTSNNVSQLVFSNTNGVSFGLNSGTVTASVNVGGAAETQSYYENMPVTQGIISTNLSSIQNLFEPFVVPFPVSVGFMRFPMSFTFAPTTIATTNNTSIRAVQSHTIFANFYSLGSGASSRSLQYFTQASVSMLLQVSATQGANSNAQTVQWNISYFSEGITTITGEVIATNPASSNFNFSTNAAGLSSISGLRMLDVPFSTSFAPGEYFVAFQRSTAGATTGVAGLSNASMTPLFAAVSNINSNINQLGDATNIATNKLAVGLGIWTATNFGGTSSSVALSLISTTASQPKIPFQFIRYA